ncbi:hypothetical protein TFLX_03940 [Thermoflexales bacterium]|nr:hypothetical protein TFLX_03940 [Thermoflexales bacterium]
MEKRTAHADRFCPLNCEAQFAFIRHLEHDEVTTILRLKAASGLKTGMPDLHDLIGQRQIGANQDIDMTGSTLLVWHG